MPLVNTSLVPIHCGLFIDKSYAEFENPQQKLHHNVWCISVDNTMHKAAHSLCKLSHMTKPSLFAKKLGMVILSRTPDYCKILLFHPSIHPLL